MKIALYKHTTFCYTIPREANTGHPDYIRVSDPVDIEFKMTPDSDLINAQVKSLRMQITSKRAEHQAEITRIENKIQSLLAIENKAGE